MNKPTNQQAIEQLYAASRLSNLTAEQHEFLRKAAEQIIAALNTPTQTLP